MQDNSRYKIYKVLCEGESKTAKVYGYPDEYRVVANNPDIVKRHLELEGKKVQRIYEGEICTVLEIGDTVKPKGRGRPRKVT